MIEEVPPRFVAEEARERLVAFEDLAFGRRAVDPGEALLEETFIALLRGPERGRHAPRDGDGPGMRGGERPDDAEQERAHEQAGAQDRERPGRQP